jgi:hypothetical protein
MISFLLIPIIILLLYFSLSGLGFYFSKVLPGKFLPYNALYPLLSFPIIFCIISYFHIFIKLYPSINLLIILFGLFLCFKRFEIIKLPLLILFTFLVTIQFIGHNVNEDFGYYHLPYVINFISDKLILGLSNLSMVQGYNSAWLNISAFFYLPYFSEKTVHFANSIISLSIIIFYVTYLKEKKIYKFSISSLYALLAISFFLIKNSRLNSFGVDVAGHIYASLVFFLLINFFENKKLYFRKSLFYLIVVFTIFSIFIKLSYIPLIVIPLICIYIEKKVFDKKIIYLSLLIGFPWILQQVAYTSCFIFPLDFTCIKFLPWYSRDFINDAAFSLEYINKSYWVYKGTLTPVEYIKDFNWVHTWFFRNLVELVENILTFLAPLIFLIIININKNLRPKKLKDNELILLFIPILLGLIIWFLKAPVTRYGIFYLNTIFFLILLFTFKSKLFGNFNSKFIYTILAVGILFNLSKNVYRIHNLSPYKEFPFPKIEKIIFKSEKKNGITFNTPIPQESNQSSSCWDTPFYCLTGSLESLDVFKLKKYSVFKIKSNN